MPTPLAMPGDGSRVVCGPAGDPDPVGPGRPRDRHTRASRLGVVDLEARPCPPDPPAPSTPAAPGVLTGWLIVFMLGQALRFLRRLLCRW